MMDSVYVLSDKVVIKEGIDGEIVRESKFMRIVRSRSIPFVGVHLFVSGVVFTYFIQ